MCLVKDLLTKEELSHIKRILEFLPEDAPVSYEVWVVHHGGPTTITEPDFLLRTFDEPEDAVDYTKTILLSDILLEESVPCKVISINVEAAIDDYEDGTVTLGTIYKKDFIPNLWNFIS